MTYPTEITSILSSLPSLPEIPGTEPALNPLDLFKTAVAAQVSSVLGVDIQKVFEGVEVGKKDADLAIAVPRFRLKEKPDESVKKVIAQFKPDEYLSTLTTDATSKFLYYTCNTSLLTRLTLTQINVLTHLHPTPSGTSSYGHTSLHVGKHALIEFSSPNIAKPFHAGHLRSTIIGAFLANLHEAVGWRVTRMNYLGDWGKQFGLLAVGFDEVGSREELEKDPIKHLYDVYVATNKKAEKEVMQEVERVREEKGIDIPWRKKDEEVAAVAASGEAAAPAGTSETQSATEPTEPKKANAQVAEGTAPAPLPNAAADSVVANAASYVADKVSSLTVSDSTPSTSSEPAASATSDPVTAAVAAVSATSGKAKKSAKKAAAKAVAASEDKDKPTKEEVDAAKRVSPTHTAAREFFRKMEAGDKEALKLWQEFRDLSIVKYKEVYKRLGIEFDVYDGESQVSLEKQKEAAKTLSGLGVCKEDKGALVLELEKWNLGKTVLMKNDGTTLYITRDIAAAQERYDKYKFDKMIYVVAAAQDLHLAQFFKVLELMKVPFASDLKHVNFGMITGMSTRKGTAVFLEQILDEAKATMHEQMRSNEDKYKQIEDPEGTSDTIGLSAVKIQDMSAKRINNYNFDWNRMKSYEGDTGPYLAYAYVRLCSVERKALSTLSLPSPTELLSLDLSTLTEPKARDIIVLLAQWPFVIQTAYGNFEPSSITTYCFKLTHAISSAYEVLMVKGAEKDVALARLYLFKSSREVLKKAMHLLTLGVLERM